MLAEAREANFVECAKHAEDFLGGVLVGVVFDDAEFFNNGFPPVTQGFLSKDLPP